MKIAVIADTKLIETMGFILPLIENNKITQIDIYCDKKLGDHPKVNFIIPAIFKPAILKNISKLFQLLFRKNKYAFVWGIYEIPHGLIAYLGNVIYRSKMIMSIIGNPGNKAIRTGLWKATMLYLAKRMDIVTVTGKRSRKLMVDMGINEGKILVLPNSVECKNEGECKIEKEYDIISIGRLSPEKELSVFLEVIKELRSSFTNIKVAIAGKGPEYERLYNMIKDIRLENNVKILGYVKDKTEFYKKGKILLLTSSTEGLPRTILEAIACGCICVTSNVGDISDLIIDNKTGFIVNHYKDVHSYVAKIKYILANEKKMVDIKSNAMKQINEHYSGKAIFRFWEDILRNFEN